MTKTSVVLWCFTDGKKGHEKQSQGLIQGLTKSSPTEFDVHVLQSRSKLREQSQLPSPDLIVGAGHATHLPVLRSRLIFGGRCIVLMKPTLPASLFDLVFVPQHDTCSSFGNVCFTEGVLSPGSHREPEPSIGTILLGGESRHFCWESEKVFALVESIVRQNPDKRWTICDSRRTPAAMTQRLRALEHVDTKHWRETSSDFLTDLVASSSDIWVTCDSVSMLYESLATRARVGVIVLPPRSRYRASNKLSRGIEMLASSNRIQLSSDSLVLSKTASDPIGDSEIRRCGELALRRLLDHKLSPTRA